MKLSLLSAIIFGSLLRSVTAVAVDQQRTDLPRTKPLLTVSNTFQPRTRYNNIDNVTEAGNNRKQDISRCGPDAPCQDGSCCGPQGTCGHGPVFCGQGCTSNCEATAMCGKHSPGGAVKCGMNLCCSATGYCGTTPDHCSQTASSSCQQGFGSCAVVEPPRCDGNRTIDKCVVGYYQGHNTQDRKCQTMVPEEIATEGYTHLVFTFAGIDPRTFEVTEDQADVPLYSRFTKLKSDKLQTWIAVGGGEFSFPGPTHTTWSDMAASRSNRATFITSLMNFMTKHGFQGVDLDWEFPGAPDRGGSPADIANLVTLVREMRAAFGTSFGISVALPPDYGSLRAFDAKAMEASVDFFGFMAYDLHGPWDATQARVPGQTEAGEIRADVLPLFYAQLNPAKINFGMALYGRGYTLAGPSKPAPCTGTPGVMSLAEIRDVIAKLKLTPKLLANVMMKQITWEDQWIAYDDEETFKMKREMAAGMCFGGTMFWSVDFNASADS